MAESKSRKFGNLNANGAKATGNAAVNAGLFNARAGTSSADVTGGDGGKISISKDYEHVEAADINVNGGEATQSGYTVRGFQNAQTSGNVKSGSGGTLDL
ncbi:hypothetical protein N7537_003770 [Penicillium hordei]|uniref:Uncharacterized protein n=1 Tax=Penicillium hordei TaxID=40994 RepID=A0AAD6H4B9_9EURO|nr:uncharacterized protein N7537_003770 [Penicillium hordei]KAJ5607151.1 hypothetical protein N7537_003770 [Penicillium hordei]